MPHAKPAAISAALSPFALGAAVFLSPALALADGVQFISGSNQIATVSGTLPHDITNQFSQFGGGNNLTQSAQTDMFWLPFSTSLSSVDAFASSGNLSNNGQLMGASVTGDLSTSYFLPPRVVGQPSPGFASETGDFRTGGQVVNTVVDTVGLFTDNPDDHSAVTLHKTLFLMGGAGDNLELNSAVTNQNFNLTADSQLAITGNGIGKSPFGDFADFNFSQDPVSGKDSFQDRVLQINFALDMHLNEFQNFSISMTLQQETELQDFTGGGITQFSVTSSYSLAWGADSFVTDDATGDFLHGEEMLSASGFNYIGQDVGGPGDTLHTPGDSFGGAPEPAAWALMLAGFGIAGASLRRRRALARA